MSCPLVIVPEAEAELAEAHDWYENQRPGLGREFLSCIEEVFERIGLNPLAFAQSHKTVRQTLVRRFPYVVCYTFDGESVTVIAVFHGHREPGEWKRRLS